MTGNKNSHNYCMASAEGQFWEALYKGRRRASVTNIYLKVQVSSISEVVLRMHLRY